MYSPAGESSKNAHQLIDLVEYMAAQSLTRKDLLIALGGGVVGDMAGFAAATYLRYRLCTGSYLSFSRCRFLCRR